VVGVVVDYNGDSLKVSRPGLEFGVWVPVSAVVGDVDGVLVARIDCGLLAAELLKPPGSELGDQNV
jgi:hypothetical protein